MFQLGLGRISGSAGLSGRIFHFAGYSARLSGRILNVAGLSGRISGISGRIRQAPDIRQEIPDPAHPQFQCLLPNYTCTMLHKDDSL